MTTEKKRRRLLWVLIATPIILFLLLAFAALPGKNIYTVSPETTYATDHVGDDGFVDNIAALNTRLRGNTTPEQNANVLIWQAIGPHPEGTTLPDEYFRWLGQPAPPEEGEYLLPWYYFLRAKTPVAVEEAPPKRDDEPSVEEIRDARQARAQKWPWKAADEPLLVEWLAKNSRPLELFAQASTRPAYYNPLVPKPTPAGIAPLINCLLPTLQYCRQAAQLFVCRAMLHLGAGRTDEAWKDLITCHRFGQVMEQGGTEVEYRAAVTIQLIAMNAETVFLSHAKLTAPRLAVCRADLNNLLPPLHAADKIDLTERFSALDTLQWMARTGSEILKLLNRGADTALAEPVAGRPFSRSTDWDAAMRLANGWYDRIVTAMRIEDLQAREQAIRELEDSLKDLSNESEQQAWAMSILGAKQRGELFGKIVIILMRPSTRKMAALETRTMQQHRNLAVAFALAAYQIDQSRYPAELTDLAPKYLPEIPKDIYSGGELKYHRTDTGYMLHSIGENRIDDQGRGKNDAPRGDDGAIEMPLKESPPLDLPFFGID